MMSKCLTTLLNLNRKRRAISPLISTVLLIGLVVFAGAIVAVVLFSTKHLALINIFICCQYRLIPGSLLTL